MKNKIEGNVIGMCAKFSDMWKLMFLYHIFNFQRDVILNTSDKNEYQIWSFLHILLYIFKWKNVT